MKVQSRHVRIWLVTICTVVLTLFAIGPVSPAVAATGTEFLYNASPPSGPVGTVVTLSGYGWEPNATLAMFWEPAGEYVTPPDDAPTVTTDANGAFTAQFTIPEAPAGTYGTIQLVYKASPDTFRYGAAFQVTGPTSVAPSAPSGLKAVPSGPRAIRLTWVDNSNNETGFMVTNGVDSRTVQANRTTFVWTGLAPGTYMCFRVSAFNPLASSDWFPSTPPYYVCTTTPSPGRPVKTG